MLQKGKQLSSMHKDISKLTQTPIREKSLFSSNLVRGVTLSRIDLKIERLVSRERKVSYFSKFRTLQWINTVGWSFLYPNFSVYFIFIGFLFKDNQNFNLSQTRETKLTHIIIFSFLLRWQWSNNHYTTLRFFAETSAVGWAINGLNKLFQLTVFTHKGSMPSTTQKTHKR